MELNSDLNGMHTISTLIWFPKLSNPTLSAYPYDVRSNFLFVRFSWRCSLSPHDRFSHRSRPTDTHQSHTTLSRMWPQTLATTHVLLLASSPVFALGLTRVGRLNPRSRFAPT